MHIEELKSNGIRDLSGAIEFLSKRVQGLFFCPDNLSRLIASISESQNPDNCICLNSNLGEILLRCTKIKSKVGVDIDQDKVELAKYLHPDLHFENVDPLSDTVVGKFDSVICFPPLGQRIEHDGRRQGSVKLYMLKSLELVNSNGRLVFVVPENFLTAPVYYEIRRKILEEHSLESVISLPRGLLRAASISLSILVIGGKPGGGTDFYKVVDRRFTQTNFQELQTSFTVDNGDLVKRWDYNFHDPKNKSYEKDLELENTKRLGDLTEAFSGAHIEREKLQETGAYLYLTHRNIVQGEFKTTENDKFVSEDHINRRAQAAILNEGDVLIPRLARSKEAYYVHEDIEQRIIAFHDFIILRGKNADYVATYLNTESGIRMFNQQINRHKRGSAISAITVQDLLEFEIPILPIHDLELASKRKLQKYSYEELLGFKEMYFQLKEKYEVLKNPMKAPSAQQLDGLQATLDEVLEKQSISLKNQAILGHKLDQVQATLNDLTSDFKSIKKLPRDLDAKLSRLNASLDQKLDKLILDQKELDFYVSEIKRWFDFYDLLETKSKKYLPEAEYIFDHISRLEDPDYSPFILQYCRALENELLKKIFRAYVHSIIDRKIDLEEEFAWDFGRKDSGKLNSENTNRLAKYIARCIKKPEDQWFFELGSMEVNLRYLTGKTVEKSPILKDLKAFVLNKFEKEILEIDFLDEIKTVINEYRNQSAHPNLIDADKAQRFHEEMKECLIRLMTSFKKN